MTICSVNNTPISLFLLLLLFLFVLWSTLPLSRVFVSSDTNVSFSIHGAFVDISILNVAVRPNKRWAKLEFMFFNYFSQLTQPPLFLHASSVSPISGCHRVPCETRWFSVDSSRLPQLSVSVSLQSTSSSSHTSCWTYFCNSPSFCFTEHQISPRGKSIPQEPILITIVACLGEGWSRCWLCDDCVQFLLHLSGDAWKHLKLKYMVGSLCRRRLVDGKSTMSLKAAPPMLRVLYTSWYIVNGK